MRQTLFLLLLLCGMPFFSGAQTAADSVNLVIRALFDGMKNSDPVLVKSTFADSAILQSIGRDATGKTVIENESIVSFAEFIGKQPKGAADERIQIDLVKIDGPLAVVWAPYKFYFNGVFSHCGVDQFTLVKLNNEWKIHFLIDTRRRKGCE